MSEINCGTITIKISRRRRRSAGAPWLGAERILMELTREQLEERTRHFAAALERYARHDDDCLYLSPLPTGDGNFGCTCGLSNALLDAEEPLIDCDMMWSA